MRKFLCLTKRNCLVFLRDRGAVLFSLLSMFIVLLLMGIFLGQMNVDQITELLAAFGGVRDAAADRENAVHLVRYWTLAGLLVVNALTVPLTVLGIMVSDAGDNRLESLYGAPVGRGKIALSYIASAVMIGTAFCLLTLFISLAYIRIMGGALLSVSALAQIFLYILFLVGIFSVILYLLALFVKSSGAWSGIATIMGTLVGFLGAIYLPMGNLPAGVADVLKYTPILHGASLLRKVCCADALDAVFTGMPKEAVAEYREFMGITVVMKEQAAGSRQRGTDAFPCNIRSCSICSGCLDRETEGNL